MSHIPALPAPPWPCIQGALSPKRRNWRRRRRWRPLQALVWKMALLWGFLALSTAPKRAEAKQTRLTMKEAVQKTIKRHPSLKAAEQSTKGARARASQARTAWIPRITLEASYALMGPVQKLTIDMGLTLPGEDEPFSITRNMGNLHNASAGVTVAWRAFDFGARSVRIAAAEALVQAQKASKKDKAAKIAYAARATYLAARFFQEVQRTTQESLNVAQKELAEIKIRKKAGLGNDLDLARSQMRIAEISSRLAQATQEQNRALSNLQLLLGLKSSAKLVLVDDLKALGTKKVGLEKTPKNHPLRKKIRALKRAARLEHKRLGRSFWPTLDVMGSFKYQYPKNYFETEEAGMAYVAGVRLSWNIFDGDLWRRKRREAALKIREIQSQDHAVEEELSRKTTDTLAKIRTAQAAVSSAQKILKSAKVYWKAAKASKKAETGTALEIKKAADSVDTARLALLKAYFDGAMARAQLLYVQGRIGKKEKP